jgi:hypothetical protein
MDWKKFLFDWRKITLFLILVIFTSVISNFGFGIWWTGADIGINYGFPFNFYGYGGGPPLISGQPIPMYFYPIALVENTIIFYLLSCLIIWVYDKFRKKRIR